ncbi:MATE family multidrug resistance protein [Palleronia aestuarii]|uniref:Multidrug-efflux transporter n=1 Tax=Palleronia aestuarii TaxID=568105 RepID=A0A2W7QBD1_9RHOB|nr:MATE family efflux transporter [Palleronia aestuarii]PZX19059.1 MATE family multidrug resistance protein [Palleronia aestuarii]
MDSATHLKRILTLGVPLVGSHLAQFSIQLTDTVMLGWYDVEVLAGQVLGQTLFFLIFIVGSGFAWAVMPLIAEAEAAGDHTQLRRAMRMALWLTGGFAVLCLPAFLGARQIFDAIGQEAALSELAGRYLWIQGWSIFPALGVMVLKSTLAALERTQVVFWVTLATVVVNAVCNYSLIFGHWGAPEMGVEGAAWASLASTLAGLVGLVVYIRATLPGEALFARLWRVDAGALLRVFRLGWPIGLTSLAEAGLFSASTVMMGWIGAVPLAAHGIALQIISVMFMIHIGLSNVATIRAGAALGRRDGVELRRGGAIVLAVSGAVAIVTVALLLVAPQRLMGLFLDPADPARDAVLAIGVGLLAAAALFQFVDAAQVMALGLLRGVQDTRVPMVFAALSYWVVGVPLAWVFAFRMGFGGIGLWLGMAVGLGLAAVLMMTRFWKRGAYAVENGSGS